MCHSNYDTSSPYECIRRERECMHKSCWCVKLWCYMQSGTVPCMRKVQPVVCPRYLSRISIDAASEPRCTPTAPLTLTTRIRSPSERAGHKFPYSSSFFKLSAVMSLFQTPSYDELQRLSDELDLKCSVKELEAFKGRYLILQMWFIISLCQWGCIRLISISISAHGYAK